MTWRDQDVPGAPHLTNGAPIAPPGANAPAPLHGFVTQAASHERVSTVTVSNSTRGFLIILGVVNVITGLLLYLYVRSTGVGLIDNVVSWGGHWGLVSSICCAAGVALLCLAVVTDWYRAATRDHLYATWAAVAASVPTTGLALATLALIIALSLLLGMIIMGIFLAALSGA